MRRKPLTAEQKQRLRDNLAKGRQTAAENRAKAAEMAAPIAQTIAEGGVWDGPLAGDDPVPADPFALFLASIDAETRELLSDDELRDIYNAQLAAKQAEKKARAKKAIIEKAGHAAAIAAGLLPQAQQDELERQRRMNEMVEVRIEMPPADENGGLPDIGFRVNGRIFLHGFRYTVTRDVYDSLKEMMYRAGESQLLFEGKNRKYRAWLMGRGQNDPRYHIDLAPNGALA